MKKDLYLNIDRSLNKIILNISKNKYSIWNLA